MAPIPDLVRDYSAGISGAELRELLDSLPIDDARYKLLIAIVDDWGDHPGPGWSHPGQRSGSILSALGNTLTPNSRFSHCRPVGIICP